MVSESGNLVIDNLMNFEQMHLLKTSKKYLGNTANNVFNKSSIIKDDNILSYNSSIILTVKTSLNICVIFMGIIIV